MKKIISLIAAIAMTTTISFGATFTKVSGGHSISINVDSGKAVKIRALDIFGKIFNGWTITGATVDDQSQKEIEITMGENDVTATANYLTPLHNSSKSNSKWSNKSKYSNSRRRN